MCAHSTPFDCDHCKAANRNPLIGESPVRSYSTPRGFVDVGSVWALEEKGTGRIVRTFHVDRMIKKDETIFAFDDSKRTVLNAETLLESWALNAETLLESWARAEVRTELTQDPPMTLGMPKINEPASDQLGRLRRALDEALEDKNHLKARVERLESFIGPAGLKRLEKLPR